jgi:hypothetical protein
MRPTRSRQSKRPWIIVAAAILAIAGAATALVLTRSDQGSPIEATDRTAAPVNTDPITTETASSTTSLPATTTTVVQPDLDGSAAISEAMASGTLAYGGVCTSDYPGATIEVPAENPNEKQFQWPDPTYVGETLTARFVQYVTTSQNIAVVAVLCVHMYRYPTSWLKVASFEVGPQPPTLLETRDLEGTEPPIPDEMANWLSEVDRPVCETTQVLLGVTDNVLAVDHSTLCRALEHADVAQTSSSTFALTVSPLAAEPLGATNEIAPTTTAASVSSISGWGGWGYLDVPQLGTEPVRGTGCGASGGLPDVIPDGIWNVVIGDRTGGDNFWTDDQILVDVQCVYVGDEGRRRHEDYCALYPGSWGCENQSDGFWIENLNPRLRTMPVAADVGYYVVDYYSNGSSDEDNLPASREDPFAFWRSTDCWIVIQGGIVTTVIAAFPRGG